MRKSKKVLWGVGGAVLLLAVVAAVGFTLVKKSGISPASADAEELKVQKLRVNHLETPLGIDVKTPVFSWQMASEKRGVSQSAYRIIVAESEEGLKGTELLWDSGEMVKSESVGISYEGAALEPKKRYYWQVQVTDQQGEVHESEISWFETGLMNKGMADAKWISAPVQVTDPAFDNTTYNIKYELEVSNGAASFVFGAAQGRYGKMYLCEIENREESAYFRIKQLDNNMQTLISEADIFICRSEENSSLFQVELRVQEEELSVMINNTEAGSFAIEKTALGSIGYFVGRGITYGWFDEILVTDEKGTALYQEDFQHQETIFSPYYVHVEEGRLRAGSGLMLTKGAEDPAPVFRKEFVLQEKEVESARVYMTALGSIDLSINGEKVTENYFDPGKLVYNQELSYVTYDVTELLKSGQANAMGVTLLHGWYDRAVGHVDIWNPWGEKNAFMGMLEVKYKDGSAETIVTDQEFLCTLDGPVRENDIYQGEYYDATCEQTGFDQPGYVTDETWQQAEENSIKEEYLSLPLTGKENEPIACVQTLTPVSVQEPAENVFVYDFGQNFAGTCRIK